MLGRTLRLLAFGILCAFQMSCHSETAEQRVVKSFDKFVADGIKNHKIGQETWFDAAGSPDNRPGWYAAQEELPDTYNIDVEKTNSLVSPFIGTANYIVTESQSFRADSKEEATGAIIKGHKYSVAHRLVCVYQNGAWKFESEECHFIGETRAFSCTSGHRAYGKFFD